jgi:hypothetical protein
LEDQQRVGTVGGRTERSNRLLFVRTQCRAVLPRLACAHSLVSCEHCGPPLYTLRQWCGLPKGLRLSPIGPCLAHRIGVRPRLTISDLISQTRRTALSRVLLGYSSGTPRVRCGASGMRMHCAHCVNQCQTRNFAEAQIDCAFRGTDRAVSLFFPLGP